MRSAHTESTASRRRFSSSKIPFYVSRFFLYLMLITLSYVFIYPILNMVITSLKDLQDSLDPTVTWIPRRIFTMNYQIALTKDVLDFKIGFMNSIVITALCTLGHLLAASFVGYGFARFRFPGRNILFAIVVLSIIIPPQVIIVPMFYEFTQLFGLLNSRLPIILPTLFGYGLRGGLFVFLFRQFIMNLPRELDEAASIDGCGKLRTHFQIIMPVSTPVILVTSVLSMVWHWNDYFEPSVYLFTPDKQTINHQLPILLFRLNQIMQQILSPDSGQNVVVPFSAELRMMFIKEVSLQAVLMAGATISIIPPLIVFIFLQRRFVQGI
jgi:multiple sugar transport system permease protein